MAKLTRREWLSLMLAGWLPMRSIAGITQLPLTSRVDLTDSEDLRLHALQAFIDTLIPADGLTPSATSLGVDKTLQNVGVKDEAYGRFLKVGCDWLNVQARGDYSALTEESREAVVDWMEQSSQLKFPYRFFSRIRYDAMSFYYSQQESWAGLGLERPPQPVGYPGYRTIK
jgi:hypothetical protein